MFDLLRRKLIDFSRYGFTTFKETIRVDPQVGHLSPETYRPFTEDYKLFDRDLCPFDFLLIRNDSAPFTPLALRLDSLPMNIQGLY